MMERYDPRRLQEARDEMAEAGRKIARYAPDDDYEFEMAICLAREAYEDESERQADGSAA